MKTTIIISIFIYTVLGHLRIQKPADLIKDNGQSTGKFFSFCKNDKISNTFLQTLEEFLTDRAYVGLQFTLSRMTAAVLLT